MVPTLILFVVFGGLLIGFLSLWTLLLRVGLRWAGINGVTRRRLLVCVSLCFLLQMAGGVVFRLTRLPGARHFGFWLAELAFSIAVPCVIISFVFRASLWRSFRAWFPTSLASVGFLLFAVLVIKPFAYELFVAPSNSMAPTLVGTHVGGICPECGAPNYGSPGRENAIEPSLLICENFHVTAADSEESVPVPGDRFVMARFFEPKRWDLVVFQLPSEPSVLYVKRLVGFPGETIHIEDGSVWVDGARQTMPERLEDLEYLSESVGPFAESLWGSKEKPAKLGADEFFVLGDFSARSADSRYWTEGARGHSPYAVPRSHIQGVVTHTYWPPSRWRIHR